MSSDMFDEHQKFKYANELIAVLRKKGLEKNKEMTILAAGYPDREFSDIHFKHLKNKVDAGVDILLTQVTFSAKIFVDYVARCRQHGIKDIPIIPGIYIPRTFDETKQMQEITGVELPEEYLAELEKNKNYPDEFYRVSLDFTVKLINEIRKTSPEYIKGCHVFTFTCAPMMVQKLTKLINFSED